MAETEGYVLGQSVSAARRLEIQDAHFAEASERSAGRAGLAAARSRRRAGLRPRQLQPAHPPRLGPGGVLVGVDCTEGLLNQARSRLAEVGPARFEPVLGDIAQLGPWLEGADVVVGRTVLHHVPMVELVLGRLRAMLRPGIRVGFLEPDFRTLLARLAWLQATGRPELAPLGVWATAINALYLAGRISPDVGATLARALEIAGYQRRCGPTGRKAVPTR